MQRQESGEPRAGWAVRRPAAHVPGRVIAGLLAAGVVSSVWYLGMDLVASFRYEGYSYASQAVSELSASGAPTRDLWIALGTVYNVLIVALAIGLWLVAGQRRGLRVAAVALAASAVVGQAAMLAFPMDIRGTDETFRGSMHGPATLLMSVLFLVAMGFAAGVHGRRFRVYTFVTIGVLVVFGLATTAYVPRVVDDQSTPGMGLVERVNIYAYLAWVAVLALSVWERRDGVQQEDRR